MPIYAFRNTDTGEVEDMKMSYEEMLEFREQDNGYEYIVSTPGFVTKSWDNNFRKAASKDGAFRENMEIIKKKHPTLRTE